MDASSQDAALAAEFARNIKGWGPLGGDIDASREAILALGHLHPAFGSTPWSFGSGCLALARMGLTNELVDFCHRIGGTAHYDGVSFALGEVRDTAALEKLARKGSKDERQKAQAVLRSLTK